ncbi:MAG: DEAD/DEAH box helicase [Deltaproteobacteria bacterium]|nr:DEAD/DEAH box helicase [Deltaproteobacteria bacterium]
MKTFNELGIREDILRSLEDLDFVRPTPIQERVIPILLADHADAIALAQSGTGKTAAFGIPLLQSADAGSQQTQALVLCPTRELCLQVANDIAAYGKYVERVKVLAVYGGANIETQISALRKGVQIVVATPGRLNDLMRRGRVDISAINTVVLDEADEMLQMGFQEELNAILAETPADKNTLLFSATMPHELKAIIGRYMTDPVQVTIGRRNAGAENVSHQYYVVQAKDRYPALKRIVDVNPDIYSIIFCRTRQETQEIADKLIQDGYNAEALHGDLSQVQRDTVMNKFRRRNTQLLVATDVAARGLDVDDLTHVINYNLPDDSVNYTHRSGRTGRAGKTGISIILIHMREYHRIRELESKLKKSFSKHAIPMGAEICEKQLMKLIGTMKNIDVDNRQIDPFLPAVMESLKKLDREELVKRFVSVEFNRFLDYYRNAPDLNVVERKNRQENRADREEKKPGRKARDAYDRKKQDSESKVVFEGKKRRDESGDAYSESSTAYSRFKINAGKKDGASPSRLMAEINEIVGDRRIRFGKIDVLNNETILEVESRFAKKVLEAFQDVMIDDEPVVIEPANDEVIRDSGKRGFRRKKPPADRSGGNDGRQPYMGRKRFDGNSAGRGKMSKAKRSKPMRGASKNRRRKQSL